MAQIIFKLLVVALSWLALTFAGGQAWGQVVKVSQAKSEPITVFDVVSVPSGTNLSSARFDAAGAAQVSINIRQGQANCAAAGSSVVLTTYTGPAAGTVSNSFAGTNGNIYLCEQASGMGTVTFSGVTETLMVSKLQRFVMFTLTGVSGGFVAGMTIAVTFYPFEGGVAEGILPAGYYGTGRTPKPVISGGVDSGGLVRTVLFDSSGRQIIVGPVAAGSATSTDAPVKIGGTDGTNVRTVLTDTGGRIITAGYAGYGQIFTPGVPSVCNLAASTSCPLTTFTTAGNCVEMYCTVDAFFRFGTGAQTALTTDTPYAAKTTRRFCMTSTQDSWAGISASAGTCSLSVVPRTP